MVYWYLRLNGFFPLHNFVLHRRGEQSQGGDDDSYSADADALAVRFPYVSEEVGGQPLDWDPVLINLLAIDQRFVVLIAEVKTSNGVSRREVEASFQKHRLEVAIQRVGIVSPAEAETLAARLVSEESILLPDMHSDGLAGRGTLLAKVLFAPRKVEGSWLTITLRHVDEFIAQRMSRYADPKFADRFFFPDPLIQYWAWRSRS